jgi:hypothetical protein
MSKQLTLSATLSVMAMGALAVVTAFGTPVGGTASRPATAHGSIVSVLLRS